MSRSVIIQSSSRKNGHTALVVKQLQKYIECDLINLKDYNYNFYDYNHQNKDDFLLIFKKILTYQTIIFATPVYWYSMSGHLKVFLDRFTDGLTIEKELGRKLRGKHMAVLSCGSEPTEVDGFFLPFKKSADYLGMHYLGDTHTWVENNVISNEVHKRIEAFLKIGIKEI